ncbi:AMP phosphorylase [Candidatus Micrarchaeota archaeon]|nr:AMP phosphorylase [Candidatus Micrarchaeota archaeon]
MAKTKKTKAKKHHSAPHTIHKPGKKIYDEKQKKKVDVWRIKPYIVQAKKINIYTGKKIIVLNSREAQENDVYAGYRENLRFKGREVAVVVDVAGDEVVKPGEVGLFRDVSDELEIEDSDIVEIVHLNRPASLEYIKKKMDNKLLEPEEINMIIKELMDNRLSEGELAAWVSAAYINGLGDEEVVALTNAIVASGSRLDIQKEHVADKHCIGGVAGNRTTMVAVPIIAAAGIYIPKTSSRAITSPAGTADTMEVFARVDFSIDELKSIVLKCNGAIVWGGGLNLASADDKLIKIRHPLNLDPRGLLLSSILAKKKSVSAKHVVIDIPVGRGTKIGSMNEAQELARDFLKIGYKLGMNVEALITDGSEPIGNGIGPALEARDVLQVLEGSGPEDLRHKSLIIAGKIFELAGKVEKGKGYAAAEHFIGSGKALRKFREIIELQGGDPKVKSDDLEIGPYKYQVKAKLSGKISHIDNKAISKLARLAGAPMDKGAGIFLYRLKGDKVGRGDVLFTIYSESESKLSFAIKALEDLEPVEMQRMLLDVITEPEQPIIRNGSGFLSE